MLRRLIPLFLLLAAMPLATAAVVDVAEHGFTIEHQVVVPVDRASVWQAATADISKWWNGDHTFSGDAANLYLDPRPLGCFCEQLGDGGGLVHLQVTLVNPGRFLRLTGGLGPLGLLGVSGNMTLEFGDAPAGDETPGSAAQAGSAVVTLTYAVGGYREGGLAALAEPVDAVLGEQLERLAAYVSTR